MFGFDRKEIGKLAIGAALELALLATIQAGLSVVIEPGPFRDVARVGLSGLALFLGFMALMLWLDRRRASAIPPRQGVRESEGPQVFPPTVSQEPRESVLRKKWQEAEARVASAEAHARNVDRAREELRQREALLHRSVDILITWLYRRENWAGLTNEGRMTEPAPRAIWADEKYRHLGLNGIDYDPPGSVPPEPGFIAPDSSANRSDSSSTPGSGLERRSAQAGSRPGELTTPTHLPLPAQDHRAAQERQYEGERNALIQGGEEIAQALRGIQDCPREEPTGGTAGALATQGREWLERADRFFGRWHTTPSSIVEAASLASVAGFDAHEARFFEEHTAPAPVWRQRLVLRIEYRLYRLRRRDNAPQR